MQKYGKMAVFPGGLGKYHRAAMAVLGSKECMRYFPHDRIKFVKVVNIIYFVIKFKVELRSEFLLYWIAHYTDNNMV